PRWFRRRSDHSAFRRALGHRREFGIHRRHGVLVVPQVGRPFRAASAQSKGGNKEQSAHVDSSSSGTMLILPKRSYRTGKINRLSSVEVKRPPRMTTAMGYSTS